MTAPARPNGAREAARFKRATHDRLRAYREAHGLGCFIALAKKCGNGIDDVTLSRMSSGEKFPIELWRSVAGALDKEEEQDV